MFRMKACGQASAVELPVTVQPINQAPVGLVPGCETDLVLMTVGCLSTEHPRFTFVRLPGKHLTSSSRLFPDRSPPGSLSQAAPGGLRADPVIRPRRARLHLPCSKAAFIRSSLRPLFCAVQGTLWRDAAASAPLSLVEAVLPWATNLPLDLAHTSPRQKPMKGAPATATKQQAHRSTQIAYLLLLYYCNRSTNNHRSQARNCSRYRSDPRIFLQNNST